jgi:hypothetical protein
MHLKRTKKKKEKYFGEYVDTEQEKIMEAK